MARGRKKDLTIPPTRTLVQQRDYRARRAQYITSLEERCRRSEEENVQLRKELVEARERLVNPAVLLPQTAAASSELLHHLSSARNALVKFNQLVFLNTQNSGASSPHLDHTTSSNYDSDSTTPPPLTSLGSHSYNDTIPRSRKELYVDDSYPPFTSPSSSPTTIMSEDRSWNSGECCGGLIDCEGLCEEEGQSDHSDVLSRTSGMRSTAA